LYIAEARHTSQRVWRRNTNKVPSQQHEEREQDGPETDREGVYHVLEVFDNLSSSRPAAAEILAGKGQKFIRILFGNRSCELAAVDKFKLPRLRSHRANNLSNSVPDEIDRSRTREIQIALAARIP